MDPVTYNLVLVNLGNAWNPSTSRVTTASAGYYFIHFSGAAHPGANLYMYFRVGSSYHFAIPRFGNNQNGVDTMSRSGILYLSSGQVGRITSDQGSYSDNGLQTIFIGFLLYHN